MTLRSGRAARCVAACLLAAAALLATASPAAAGSFRVSQCNAVADGGSSPAGVDASAWSVSNGWPEVECGLGGGLMRLGTPNWRLAEHADATMRFALPGSMPRTTARTAWLDWRFNPQSPSTNPAFLAVCGVGRPAADRHARPGRRARAGRCRRARAAWS